MARENSRDLRIGPAAVALLSIVVGAVAKAQAGQPCTPEWDHQFALGSGVLSGVVVDMVYFDEGMGERLFLAGLMEVNSPLGQSWGIARWDGDTITPVGAGLAGFPDKGETLVVHDDGSGVSLFLGGIFSAVGGVPANNVARWDGEMWHALGTGTNDYVTALAVFDDGDGPSLHATGYFTSAGGTAVNRIARWDGEVWHALGSGLTWWNPGEPASARSLSPLVDHEENRFLAVCGSFIYGGDALGRGLAMWDGETWTVPLGWFGGSRPNELHATERHDGMMLYIGGRNLIADGQPGEEVLEWDGTRWRPLVGLSGAPGVTLTDVTGLQTFNDGSGPALFAGGFFTLVNEQFCPGVAKWDGEQWHPLGLGLAGFQPHAEVMIEDRFIKDRPALIFGGQFSHADGAPMNGVARYLGCYAPCPADLSGDREINTDDLNILLSGFGCTGDPGTCPGDIDEDGDTDTTDLNIILSVFGTSCPN